MRRIAFFLVSLTFLATSRAQTGELQRSTISVSATASVTADPAIADFRLSIITRQQEATAAFKTYLDTYNSLENSLKGIVDSTRLMTDNLSVTPHFDYKKPEQVSPDYYQVTASMSLSVPVSDLNKALGSVTSVEGITINGIAFRAKDQEKLEIQALDLAVRRAREKAESIARLEGLSDLKVKSMSTSFSRPPIGPMYGMAEASMVAPSVNASSVSVSATIETTYTAIPK